MISSSLTPPRPFPSPQPPNSMPFLILSLYEANKQANNNKNCPNKPKFKKKQRKKHKEHMYSNTQLIPHILIFYSRILSFVIIYWLQKLMCFILTFSYINIMHLTILIFPFNLLQSPLCYWWSPYAAPYSSPLISSLVFKISLDCTYERK